MFQLFLTVDSSLGKADYILLSDQTLMEMLIEGFDDEIQNKYKDNDGMYINTCKWSSVTCDDDQRVIEIDMDSTNVSGLLELCYVPPRVKELYIRSRYKNKLTGSVDLTQLPEGMQRLYLQNNQLIGDIDLTQLPKGMKYLFLVSNELTGEIDLTRLPDGMQCLYLENNSFTGQIDLTQLPNEMKYLFLENNQLSGSFVIKALTNGMFINAQGNNFNAVAVVDSETCATIRLQGSGVTSVVDENGKAQDMKQFLR